jgi:hypothetical protein
MDGLWIFLFYLYIVFRVEEYVRVELDRINRKYAGLRRIIGHANAMTEFSSLYWNATRAASEIAKVISAVESLNTSL